MTASLPWAQRLLQRRRELLAAAVAIAVVASAAWLWVAAGDGTVTYPTVPAGQSHHAGGGTWTLTRLTAVNTLPGGTRPVTGAVFVVADIQADLSNFGTDDFCSLRLHVQAWEFDSEVGYLPTDPMVRTSCRRGDRGVVSAAFEVPASLLDRVDGVVLATAEGRATVLAGRIG
jgi:hypothetical protein